MTSGRSQLDAGLALTLAVLMLLSIPAGVATVGATGANTPDAGTTVGESSSDGETTTDDSDDGTTLGDESSNTPDAAGSVWETADTALAEQSGDATLAREQLALVRDLQTISDSSRSDRDEALDIADAVIEQRKQWAASEARPLPSSMVSQFETTQTKLAGSRKLLETAADDQSTDSLTEAVTLAKQGTKVQAALADDSVSVSSELPAVETPDHASPSAATLALMERYGATPTAADRAAMRDLDDLPEPTRSELTDYLNAFLAFQRTTAANDATRIFAARNQLLEETVDLSDALESTDSPGVATPQGHKGLISYGQVGSHSIGCDSQIPDVGGKQPSTLDSSTTFCVLTIDDTGTGNTYSTNTVVLIDHGGSDTYDMNAGGTNLDDNCGGPIDVNNQFNSFVPTNNTVDADVAAALVDLGSAGDTYERSQAIGCGQRGGASHGSGFLVDDGGGDTYGGSTANDDAHFGTNGGASSSLPEDSSCCVGGVASGFLLDAGSGDDDYKAGRGGANGGAANGHANNFGFLLDEDGNDDYNATANGVNGGAISASASGFLADLGGHDNYSAEAKGTNGGALFQAEKGGFLLDHGSTSPGNYDNYTATSMGTNGGGAQESNGFLVDSGVGIDNFTAGHENKSTRYKADIFSFETGPVSRQQGLQGVNGGGMEASVGTLINVGGVKDTEISEDNDIYRAGDGQGSNGGAFEQSAGLLVDTGGDDNYTAGFDPTNNSTWKNNGAKRFPSAGSNGGGAVAGVGAVVDTGGTDNYTALDGHLGGVNGTNGGAWSLGAGATGLTADLDGANDSYRAISTSTSGDANDPTSPDSGPVTGANGGGSGFGEFVATSAIEATVQFTNDTLHKTVCANASVSDDTCPDVEHQRRSALRATGTLVDSDGKGDEYIAIAKNSTSSLVNETVAGVNGGAYGTTSTGTLVDQSGAYDHYEAADDSNGANGENGGVVAPAPITVGGGSPGTVGVALLLDGADKHDTYIDDYCSNNDDDTVLPKGIAGAQIDSSSATTVFEWGCDTKSPG